jgi:hypothetical protein
MAVDIVGAAAGNARGDLEALLPEYDVVFAKARTALEAMAVGCATVLADGVGAGPLVTPGNYQTLRARNFGVRELTQTHTAGWYATQLEGYDRDAAAEVSSKVRSEAGLETAIDRLLEIYAAARRSPVGPGDPGRAAAAHLAQMAGRLKEARQLTVQVERVTRNLDDLRGSANDRERRQAGELSATRARIVALEQEIAAYEALPTLRLRDAVLATPLIGGILRRLARGAARRLPR